MEINISQLRSLNLVNIDGLEIENVDRYSIGCDKEGNAELTLTIKVPDFKFTEISVVGGSE